jgi:hypothetical protein
VLAGVCGVGQDIASNKRIGTEREKKETITKALEDVTRRANAA